MKAETFCGAAKARAKVVCTYTSSSTLGLWPTIYKILFDFTILKFLLRIKDVFSSRNYACFRF